MSLATAKLADVAPAKALKKKIRDASELTWHLNLDQVESQTGRVIAEQIAPISEAGNSTHWFDDRHVLYSKLRPYLNKVVVPEKEGIATTELVPMLPDPSRLDRTYLAHYLRSNQFVNWVSEQVAGAKMPRVSMKVFWDHEIPLPPLAEQKRIAAILDKADGLRRKRQQAIDLADQFLRSVFLDMFGDPVTNPKGWKVEPLRQSIVHANNGLSRRRHTETNVGDIVLRLQDVQYEGICYGKELNRIALEEIEKSRFGLHIGDILFIRVNGNPEYVGRSAVFEGYSEAVFHNDHLIRIKLAKDLEPRFLCFLFNHKSGRKVISSQVKTSAGQHTISQGGIENLNIYRPPIQLQNKFVEIQKKVLSVNFDTSDVHELFNSLSQKAFSGEL